LNFCNSSFAFTNNSDCFVSYSFNSVICFRSSSDYCDCSFFYCCVLIKSAIYFCKCAISVSFSVCSSLN
jgi:hypothetical protein